MIGTAERPRLNVFRSLNHIYAQVIDDIAGTRWSLRPRSTRTWPTAPKMRKQAKAWASWSPSAPRQQGINKVVFDRGGYLYHGRIKALAEGAREGGLDF